MISGNSRQRMFKCYRALTNSKIAISPCAPSKNHPNPLLSLCMVQALVPNIPDTIPKNSAAWIEALPMMTRKPLIDPDKCI